MAQKLNLRCEAKDLYISDWFKKCRDFVELHDAEWFVLSAKYGLVAPTQIIDPYELTLNSMNISSRKEWAERVLGQLELTVPELTFVTFLAGDRYREFLIKPLSQKGVRIAVPMKGLRIGEQKSWLKKNTT